MFFWATMNLLDLFLIWLLREWIITMNSGDSRIFTYCIFIVVVFINGARGIVNLPFVNLCLLWWVVLLLFILVVPSIILLNSQSILVLIISSCGNIPFWFYWCCFWMLMRWHHLLLWQCLDTQIFRAIYILENFLWLLFILLPKPALLILAA